MVVLFIYLFMQLVAFVFVWCFILILFQLFYKTRTFLSFSLVNRNNTDSAVFLTVHLHTT